MGVGIYMISCKDVREPASSCCAAQLTAMEL